MKSETKLLYVKLSELSILIDERFKEFDERLQVLEHNQSPNADDIVELALSEVNERKIREKFVIFPQCP